MGRQPWTYSGGAWRPVQALVLGHGSSNRSVKAAWVHGLNSQTGRSHWRQFWPPTGMVLGEPWDGGYYAGDISADGSGAATHHLILAPRSTVVERAWKTSDSIDEGLNYSRIDGSGICNAAGSNSSYPAMAYCHELNVNGFSDWYLPAQAELEVIARNLSPFTASTNNANVSADLQTFGWNPWGVSGSTGAYADPHPRCVNSRWWAEAPEAFLLGTYWCSTQCGGPPWPNYGEVWSSLGESGMAWAKMLRPDSEYPYLSDVAGYKTDENRVWPIRRIHVGTGNGGPLAVP
jgi:hypothetical protein